MTREEILAMIAPYQSQLRELGVSELALFGSYARGEATDASDIDFIVDFERKSFDSYMAIKELLESLFQRRVDLVMKSSIKARLRDRILAEAVRAA